MKPSFFTALLMGILLAWSCKPDSGTSGSTPPISFSATTLERQGGPDCHTAEEGRCTRIEMVYPMAAGEEALAQKINDSIQSTLSSVLRMLNAEEDPTLTLDQLADGLLASYDTFLIDVPDYEMGWWVESSYEIHQNTSKVSSIELMISSFTGGAHPVGFSETFNYSVPDGNVIALADLVTDKTGFLQLVEKEFKQSRGLAETDSLAQEGFFYDEAFTLPMNFVFTEQGLYLIYNVYEAAPYALGPTEFLIPYDKLQGLMNLERIR